MTIYALPDAEFNATTQNGTSGLVGTITVGIYNPETDGWFYGPTTIGITEGPPGSGIYTVVGLVAPGVSQSYLIVWSEGPDPDQQSSETLVVVFSSPLRTLKPIVGQVRMLPGVFTQVEP